MRKILTMALCVIAALCFASCSNAKFENVENPIKDSRFVEVERNYYLGLCVVYDKETMVMYTVSAEGDTSPLLDSTSRPLTYKRNQ